MTNLGDYARTAYNVYHRDTVPLLQYDDLTLDERNRWKIVANEVLCQALSQDEKVIQELKKSVDAFLEPL